MTLNKRILRDFKRNLVKYVLVFIVVSIAMYVVVSMAGAATTVMTGVKNHAESNNVENGQFSVFVELSDAQTNMLEDMGVSIEKHFFCDFDVNGTTVRVYESRNKIDLIELDEGRLPLDSNEIVLEKQYCQANHIMINDDITLAGRNFKVVGIGSSPDYDDMLQNLTDASSDSNNFGTGFVTNVDYSMLRSSDLTLNAETLSYAYLLNESVTLREFRDKLSDIKFNVEDVRDEIAHDYFASSQSVKEDFLNSIVELGNASNDISGSANNLANVLNTTNSEYSIGSVAESLSLSAEKLESSADDLKASFNEFNKEYLDFSYTNLKEFIEADNNPRINASADDIKIDGVGALIAGIIILILLAYILSVFTTNVIDADSKIIGTLYSMGYKRKELLIHYMILPVSICFVGGVLGTALGFIGMNFQVAENSAHFSYPFLSNEYPLYLFAYGIGVPLVLSCVINMIVLNKKLNRQPLALMRKELKNTSNHNVNLHSLRFESRFRIKLFLKEFKAQLIIAFGIFISLLLVMLAVTIYCATTSIIRETNEDVGFKYMYYMSYPEKESPDNAEKAYMLKLNRSYLNNDFEVSVLGIESSSASFPFGVDTSDDEVFISTSVANKYHLAVGDSLELTDEVNNIIYKFTIKKIVSYAPGLFVFMNINEMRERFNESDDYYNVLISQEKLNIDSNRVYSVTTDTSIKNASEIFWSLMKGLVFVLIAASLIMFVSVMYLMVKMIIDRQTISISLFKVLGFSDNELSKLFLRNNLYTVIISAGLFIPVTKWIIEKIYPFLTSNRSVGFNLSFQPEIYVLLFLLIVVSYVISYLLVKRNLKGVSIQEILKDRE